MRQKWQKKRQICDKGCVQGYKKVNTSDGSFCIVVLRCACVADKFPTLARMSSTRNILPLPLTTGAERVECCSLIWACATVFMKKTAEKLCHDVEVVTSRGCTAHEPLRGQCPIVPHALHGSGKDDDDGDVGVAPPDDDPTYLAAPIATLNNGTAGNVGMRTDDHGSSRHTRDRNEVDDDHILHPSVTPTPDDEEINADLLADSLLQAIEEYVHQPHVGLRRKEFRDGIRHMCERFGYPLRIEHSDYHRTYKAYPTRMSLECAHVDGEGISCPFKLHISGRVQVHRNPADTVVATDGEQRTVSFSGKVTRVQGAHNHAHCKSTLYRHLPPHIKRHGDSMVEANIPLPDVIRF